MNRNFETERAAIAELLSDLYAAFGGREFTIKELTPDKLDGLEARISLGGGSDHSKRTRLGRMLGRLADEPFTIGPDIVVAVRVVVPAFRKRAAMYRVDSV